MDVAVPQLMDKPQDKREYRNVQKGNVVLCRRHEGDLAGSYKYRIVEEVYPSADGVVCKVDVWYRNHGEDEARETHRNVHKLVIIRKDDEVDLWSSYSKLVGCVILCNSKKSRQRRNTWIKTTPPSVMRSRATRMIKH